MHVTTAGMIHRGGENSRLLVILILVVGMFGTRIIAQEQDVLTSKEVDLPVVWNVGDKVHYELAKTRMQTGRTGSNTSTTPLEIEVLEANVDGYLIGWKLGKTKLPDTSAINNPIVQQVSELFNGFQFRLQLDRSPSIVGVQNWKELQTKMEKTLKLLSQTSDATTAEAIKSQFKPIFGTKESITAFATRDAQMFFFVIGGGYSAETYHYEDLLPNPFGGQPFPSKGELRLESLDERQAVISWSQTLDPQATLKIITQTIEDMAERMGKPIDDLKAQVGDFETNDQGEFAIDLQTGWPNRVQHTRSIRSGKTQRVDTLEYRRIAAQ